MSASICVCVCAVICVYESSMVEVVRWPNPPCEALGIITERDYRSCSQDFKCNFFFFPASYDSFILSSIKCVFFSVSLTKGRARCWCFITLTEAEWCYIIKSLLKGWGLSIITAAAFMFSLASASLRCHRWPFVPYQRRLWSSGGFRPVHTWHRLTHTRTLLTHAHTYTLIRILFAWFLSVNFLNVAISIFHTRIRILLLILSYI